MRILGIDPGYERMGIAVLEKGPGERKERVLFSDCVRTSPKLPHEERLVIIGSEVGRVIDEYAPDLLAIETLFFNTNQKTAMHVAEARGVMLFAAAARRISVRELTPMEIKTAVTGYGRSAKGEVTKMVGMLVSMEKRERLDDEYDAIAAAVAGFAYLPSTRLLH